MRLILNQFREISAPHPPHILKTFIPLLDQYQNLKSRDNFEFLVKDVCEYVNENPVPWSNIKLQTREVTRKCNKPDLFEIFRAVYELKAENDDADIWCCKSTFNAEFAYDLEAHGIKPIYVYLYRDGRDVAASFRKTIVGPKHIYHIAKEWKRDQEMAKDVLKLVGKERFFSVKYEQLITDPEKALFGLCQKIGVKFDPKVETYYNSEESMNTARAGKMWENLTKPIMRGHYGLYKKELAEEDIRLFERLAGEVLVDLGYNNVEISGADCNQEFTSDQLQAFDRINEEMKVSVIGKAQPEELKRRAGQEAVIEKIKRRFDIID